MSLDDWGEVWGFYWRPGKLGYPYSEHIRVTDVSGVGQMLPEVEAEARRLLAKCFSEQMGYVVHPDQIYLVVRNLGQELA